MLGTAVLLKVLVLRAGVETPCATTVVFQSWHSYSSQLSLFKRNGCGYCINRPYWYEPIDINNRKFFAKLVHPCFSAVQLQVCVSSVSIDIAYGSDGCMCHMLWCCNSLYESSSCLITAS